jgi:hemolysin III
MHHTSADHEERVNALSHGVGLVLALAALPVLASQADADMASGMPRRAGLLVFGISMLMVYLASSVYHACPEGRAKLWLQRVDHAAIYLFMAGSYTPFALRDVPGGPGWVTFGAVWALAALGMAMKLLNRLTQRGWSTALYVAFGWLVALAAQPFLAHLPAQAVNWVIAGGLAYTAGTYFFLMDRRLRYGHLVWHLFVLAGSACHLMAVLV